MKKVIVIGLDGLEPKIVESLLAAGDLPNLAQLGAHGGYARIGTTCPAQTPVAWSTFATGTNPGGHGIFDFIRRDPATYLPDFSLNRFERKAPYLPAEAVNLRRGAPVWELLSAAGIPSTIIRCPCTFPPDSLRGRMLAGMGVPDLRGGQGTSTLYTSTGHVTVREHEQAVKVQPDANGTIRTHLVGPRNPKTRADFRCDMTIHLEPAAKKIVLRSAGQPAVMELREGEWSEWLKVKFKTGLVRAVRGAVRFFLVQVAPVFELYASPVNFDPDAPLFPISSPPGYARELAAALGTFYTTGMVEDHSGFEHDRLSASAYLEQCAGVLRERERMLHHELARFSDGLLFCLFDTPDRVQHMFWRSGAGEHAGMPGDIRGQWADVITEHYRDCDAVVGRALEYADDRTLFLVLSDHGMNSFQRGVHLNTWLYDHGFLALRSGIRPGDGARDFFHGVDWERTKAYALGLAGIYLNLKGREGRGIVDAAESGAVTSAIVKGLTGLGDPKLGKPAIRSVVSRQQVYAGPYAAESPDLVVNCASGFRVSWRTTLGGVPQGIFEDNGRKWAADHIIDPHLVPGILFINQASPVERPHLVDLAPTILDALGVPRGAAMEGRSVLG